jgi:hypothetical protein
LSVFDFQSSNIFDKNQVLSQNDILILSISELDKALSKDKRVMNERLGYHPSSECGGTIIKYQRSG